MTPCFIEVECPLQQGLRRHKNWLRQLLITIEVECPLQQGLRQEAFNILIPFIDDTY